MGICLFSNTKDKCCLTLFLCLNCTALAILNMEALSFPRHYFPAYNSNKYCPVQALVFKKKCCLNRLQAGDLQERADGRHRQQLPLPVKVTSRTLVIARNGFGAKFFLYVLEMNQHWTAWNSRYFSLFFLEKNRTEINYTQRLFVKHKVKVPLKTEDYT